jgi:hypothetical protein
MSRKRQAVAVALFIKRRVIEERIVPDAFIWMGEEFLRDLLQVLDDALSIVDVGVRVQKILEAAEVQHEHRS